ncbi:MAG: hypothetical protein JKY54_06575, partial [Flavobacteriales bacterium]|nr:hypothetical protein [Flavobacteriales bacterium]
MKLTLNHILTLALIIVTTGFYAQQTSNHIMLNSGSLLLEENVNDYQLSYATPEVTQGHVYRLIQVNALPTMAQHSEFKRNGISLVEYIPNRAYVAKIPVGLKSEVLAELNIRSIVPLPQEMKLLKKIVERPFPAWANDGGKTRVVIKIHEGLSVQYGLSGLGDLIRLTAQVGHSGLIYASVDEEDIELIANKPFVRHIDLAPEEGQPEHDHGRTLHRANMLNQDLATGRQYDGTGVTVCVNDDGFVGPHIDFTGR